MKDNKFKICIAILLIIIICMISFLGIYKKEYGIYDNIVKDLKYAMDMSETRFVTLEVSDDTYEMVRDSNGDIVTDTSDLTDEEKEENGYTTSDVLYNSEELVNEENLAKNAKQSAQIFEKRLQASGIDDYKIYVDDQSGIINIELKNTTSTNQDLGSILGQGKFEIRDAKSGEVLLNSDDLVKVEAKVSTSSESITSTSYITYLDFTLTKEGKEKLKEISNTYLTADAQKTKAEEQKAQEELENATLNSDEETQDDTTDQTSDDVSEESSEETAEEETSEEEEETYEDKQIAVYIDQTLVLSTAFDEEISDGTFQLTYGSSTTDFDTYKGNAESAQTTANLLSFGATELYYDAVDNINIETLTTLDSLKNVLIIVALCVLIGLLYYIFAFKSNGLLASIGYVGFVGLYLLIIRYTNVEISISGMFAMVGILIINYILTLIYLIKVKNYKQEKQDKIKEEQNKLLNQTILNNLLILVPVIAICIALVFASQNALNTFGMLSFWGLLISFIYNYILAYQMVKLNQEDKLEQGGHNE